MPLKRSKTGFAITPVMSEPMSALQWRRVLREQGWTWCPECGVFGYIGRTCTDRRCVLYMFDDPNDG